VNRIRPFLFLIACCIAIVGCNKPDDTSAGTGSTPPLSRGSRAVGAEPRVQTPATTDLVGAWDSADDVMHQTGTMEFKSDNSFTAHVESKIGSGTLTSEAGGTYNVSADKLTFHYAKFTSAGSNDDTNKLAEVSKGNIPQDETYTMEWSSKDGLKLSKPNDMDSKAHTVVMKRKAG
jgi:hypothetical protein